MNVEVANQQQALEMVHSNLFSRDGGFWERNIGKFVFLKTDKESSLRPIEMEDFSKEIEKDANFMLGKNAEDLLALVEGDSGLLIDLTHARNDEDGEITETLAEIVFPGNRDNRELLKIALQTIGQVSLSKELEGFELEREIIKNLPLIGGREVDPRNTLLNKALLLTEHVLKQKHRNLFMVSPVELYESYIKENEDQVKKDMKKVPDDEAIAWLDRLQGSNELKDKGGKDEVGIAESEDVPDWLKDIAKEEKLKQKPTKKDIPSTDMPMSTRKGDESLIEKEESHKPEGEGKIEIEVKKTGLEVKIFLPLGSFKEMYERVKKEIEEKKGRLGNNAWVNLKIGDKLFDLKSLEVFNRIGGDLQIFTNELTAGELFFNPDTVDRVELRKRFEDSYRKIVFGKKDLVSIKGIKDFWSDEALELITVEDIWEKGGKELMFPGESSVESDEGMTWLERFTKDVEPIPVEKKSSKEVKAEAGEGDKPEDEGDSEKKLKGSIIPKDTMDSFRAALGDEDE